MDTQKIITLLKNIRDTQGNAVFLNVDRLSSYVLDLSRGQDTADALPLMKAVYHCAEPEIASLIDALRRNGSDTQIRETVYQVKAALAAAFFPAGECRDLLNILLGVFDRDFNLVDDGHFPSAPALSIARFSAALQALDDKYENELWKSGTILSSLLADQDAGLSEERRLVERVYEAAGTDVRKLVSLIVKKKDERSQIRLLQKKLQSAFIADCYIDAFLESVLDLFGREYPFPLTGESSSAGKSESAGSPKASGQTADTGKSAGSSADAAHPAAPGRSGAQAASAGQNPTAGHPAQTPSALSSAPTSAPAKKKGKKKMLVLLLAIALLIWFVPRLSGGSDTDADSSTAGTGENSTGSGTDDSTGSNSGDDTDESGADSIEGLSQTAEEQEPELYQPRLESEISLDSVGTTVYGDNVTDLHSYSRYEARGKNFTFAYPRNLYTDVNLVSDTFDTSYVFTGTDDSYLEYHIKSMTTKYSSQQWRETLTRSLTSGMTDVQLLAYADGDDEGHFYLTAKEGGLDVVIVSTLYVSGGPAEWMILKYPTPTDDQDALRKAYLAECLYCLAGFSDSSSQGLSLRSFEEFTARN